METSKSSLESAPEPSVSSLKRKAAVIVVSDDEEEDTFPVSNTAAQSLPEVLLSLKMTKDRKVAIPKSVWARVQEDDSISVRQYNKASPGGFRDVEKTATHLPNSGVKPKGGESLMTPISSFMVKDFKANVLLISGQSVSTAKNVRDNSNPKVSRSTFLWAWSYTITLFYLT